MKLDLAQDAEVLNFRVRSMIAARDEIRERFKTFVLFLLKKQARSLEIEEIFSLIKPQFCPVVQDHFSRHLYEVLCELNAEGQVAITGRQFSCVSCSRDPDEKEL